MNGEAVKRSRGRENERMKKQSLDGFLIQAAADAVASVELEALSRFVGEGGREAPGPVMELIDIPLVNGIWRRPRPAAHQANQKKTGPGAMKLN